jgi:hypothetical protein
MSQDDRIRQLTGLFLEDLRGPIEASFKQLLEQVMAMAAEDETAAIDAAVARARAEHQAALDEALAAAERHRDAALEALHDGLTGEHDAAIETLRTELASERRAAVESLESNYERHRDAALEALHDGLTREHDAAVQALRTDLAKEHEDVVETLRAHLAQEHEAALEALRAELVAQHESARDTDRTERDRQQQEALDALTADLALRHGQALDALRAEKAAEHDAAIEVLQRSREETVERLRREAEGEREAAVQAAREELGREHEAAVATLREQLRRDHQEATASERETWAGDHEATMDNARSIAEATAAALAAAERERDAARASVAELTDQLAVARAQHEQLTEIAHAEAEAAAEMAQGVAVDTHVAERQAEMACSDRVVAAMRALDEARSLSEVLTTLTDHAASDAVRVAVLLAHGTRLRGWRFAGMGDVQAATVDVPVARAGAVGRALERGVAVSSSEADTTDATALPAFLATPAGRVGLALPILVGGRVVAVLYADDAGSGTPVVPSDWPELTEVLARHAGRCLEVLTLSRAAAVARPVGEWHALRADAGASPHVLLVKETEEQEEESARRHARLLISEIKLYNEELVERGRRDGNLAALLGSEIERARRLYEEKIPAAVRQRVDCFDEEIVRTLAGGDRTLLGQVT